MRVPTGYTARLVKDRLLPGRKLILLAVEGPIADDERRDPLLRRRGSALGGDRALSHDFNSIMDGEDCVFLRPPTARARPKARNASAGRIISKIAALACNAERNIVIVGDAGVTSALLKSGLIDEVRLFISPQRVEAGTSIYNRRPAARRWILTEAAIYNSGIVYRKYLLMDRR